MGSPEGEHEDRTDDEGPQKKVQIEPFWIGQTEIPWALYKPFYENGIARNKDGSLLAAEKDKEVTVRGKQRKKAVKDALARGDSDNIVDVVSQPTPQYHDMFGSGEHASDLNYPAMCTTHHAASKFCQWLSAQTGHFYRLPTSGWGICCRAGTKTAFHFGDDMAKLDDYAWHGDNSEFTTTRLQKNRIRGLYDMHGNVAEWVLDGFSEGYQDTIKDGAVNPNVSLTRYPRIVKGGSWDQSRMNVAVQLGYNASRTGKIPIRRCKKYLVSHGQQFIGFRIVRPLKTPSAERCVYWNTDWWSPNTEDL